MNITEIFIRRPVMTVLVMLGIFLFGMAAYHSLPVSDLPSIDFPTIQVTAGLPGASPETMAASVATPLERQFSTIPGLDSMTSSSSRGTTSITLQFSLTRDLDAAALDVNTAIAAAVRRLPSNMPSTPTFRKVNPADTPIFALVMSSSAVPVAAVNDYAETMVAPGISMVGGVAQVSVYGAQKFAVRVQADPNLLAVRGIGIDDVETALRHHNVNLPTGNLWDDQKGYTVRATGQLDDAAQYRRLIVAYRNGAPVRLKEVAQVIDGVENDKVGTWYRDRRAVSLVVQRQPGTNTVDVVDRIRALLPHFRNGMPEGINLEVLYDRSESIRESVDDVKLTLLLTIGLVVLVIFLFLRNASATIIPSLALPMSIVGSLSVMYLAGFTLDNLSLMALTLSVGFVVDDAVVILENIVRHMESGKSRLEAALEGGREVGFTIVSMTLSLAAVFIPVVFMGGIMGRLFREFAVVVMVTILLSGFVSLSLTPMLCSRFLRPAGTGQNLFLRSLEAIFSASKAAYAWTLRCVLRHRILTMATAGATLVATVYLFELLPKGLIPNQDTGQLSASTEGPSNISFDAMVRLQQQAGAILAAEPDIEAFTSTVGQGGISTSVNQGRFMIRLRPRDQRFSTPEHIIERLRPDLNRIPGIQTYLQNPPLIRIGGNISRSVYQYTLTGTDIGELYRVAADFEVQMRNLQGLADVNSDLRLSSPEVTVNIDRDRASSLGVDADAIEGSLYSAYGARPVSNIYTATDTYWVILELLPKYARNPRSLELLHVRSDTGRLVRLSSVAEFRESMGALSIAHLGQLPAVTISFNLLPNVSLGKAVDQIENLSRKVLPTTVSTTFQGTAAAYKASLAGMGVLVAMAILVVYLILGILYESFIHPITILSGLPSAGLGALATLLLFHQELNIYSFVGLIMLIGIVKKNAIMMIDFALEGQRNRSIAASEAIYDACLVRFRPIMMTTMAALVGAVPIALGLGAGGEARRPLGLAVVGGLVVSQLLTLYITPVFYLCMEKIRPRG